MNFMNAEQFTGMQETESREHFPSRQVSERSIEFRAHVAETKSQNKHNGETDAFGQNHLDKCATIRALAESYADDDETSDETKAVSRRMNESLEQDVRQELDKARESLRGIASESVRRATLYVEFFEEMAESEDVSKMLYDELSAEFVLPAAYEWALKFYGNTPSEALLVAISRRLQEQNPDVARTLAWFSHEILKKGPSVDVSDALMEKMLSKHLESFSEKRKVFDEALPGLKADYLARIHERIADGTLRVDDALIRQRLDDIDIALYDSLATDFEDVNGDYSPGLNLIRIGSDRKTEEELTLTLTHELTHAAISGRGMKAHREESEGYFKKDRVYVYETEEFVSIEVTRSGLEPRWLNEALTEEIKLRLLGISDDDPRGTYVEERQKLRELYAQDSAIQPILYDAYAENVDPDDPAKLQAWEAVIERLNAIHGSTEKSLTYLNETEAAFGQG